MTPLENNPPGLPRSPEATPQADPVRPAFRWVPVRSLGPQHRSRIADHLLQLSAHDRHLRFGYAASDEHIQRYVDQLRFDRDDLFGIFNRRLEIIAMAHLAHTPASDAAQDPTTAEFAVSVRDSARGRGYGSRLFDHAVMHARNRGIGALVIHALSENAAMLALARKAGATVEQHGSESEARLALPPDDWSSRLEQAVEGRAADLNYRIKLEARRLGEWLDAWSPATLTAAQDASAPEAPAREPSKPMNTP